jgi:hypothetical protein
MNDHAFELSVDPRRHGVMCWKHLPMEPITPCEQRSRYGSRDELTNTGPPVTNLRNIVSLGLVLVT